MSFEVVSMRNNTIPWSKASLPYAIEDTKKHFTKMFPATMNYDENYILWLKFSLYWPFQCESMDCKISLFVDGEGKLDFADLKVRHLYPNKLWYTACMKSGRKCSDTGLIIPYDSFEKLSKVKKVMAYWTIRYVTDDGQQNCRYLCVDYDLSFTQAEGKRNYTVNSAERTLLELLGNVESSEKSDSFKYIKEQYDHIFILQSKPERVDLFQISSDKGAVPEEVAFDVFYHSPNPSELDLQMDCFTASATITPSEVFEGL